MGGALEKVHKLLKLTASPEPEEARTAALLACRLIAENGYTISETAARQKAPREAPQNKPWNGQNDNGKSGNGEQRRRTKNLMPDGGIPIAARFGSNCVWCGSWYDTDDSIVWYPGRGAIHAHCWHWGIAEHIGYKPQPY